MIDTLSDVLRAVRLNGGIFFAVDATEPWVAETPSGSAIAPHLMPGVDHVIDYHVVTRGACWGGMLGEEPTHLEAGDVIVFPQGDAHVISSRPGMRGNGGIERYRTARQGRLPVSITIDGGGEPASIICGFLGCDARPFNPLLATLPRVIHMRAANGGEKVRRLIEMAVEESTAPTPGGECVLSHLSELLFVEVVRRYVAALPSENVGWFAALRDESVGRALQKLHQRPSHPWSLEDLAKEVAVSRSVLADRFAQLVGVPPMQYLAQWRIQLAASLLRSESASLAEIAARVGYGSEAALSRAFKRWVGVAPGQYRRSAEAPPA